MEIEILDLVDENDNVIGKEERNIALKKGRKNIRVIEMFIFTSDNKIIVPLRSDNRILFPNCYDFSVGGYVTSGDSYEKTAYKELEEELGITNVKLEEVGYFKPTDSNISCFTKLYKLVYDGKLNYDKDGIADIFYFTKEEIIYKIESNPDKFKSDYKLLFNFIIEKENL